MKAQPDWKQIEADYCNSNKTLRQLAAEYGVSHTGIHYRARREAWQRIPAPGQPIPENQQARKAATQAQGKTSPWASRHLTDPGTTPDPLRAAGSMATPDSTPRFTSATTCPIIPLPERTPQQPQEVEAQADIILAQQQEIPRARILAARMLRELEAQTGYLEAFQQLGHYLDRIRQTPPTPASSPTPAEQGSANIGQLEKSTTTPRLTAREQEKLQDLYQKAISLPGRVGTLKSLTDILKILVALERQVFGIENELPRTPVENLSDDQVQARLNRLISKTTV